jgi:Tfp pilus assembly protein PilX
MTLTPMKTHPFKKGPTRGSALLASLIVIVILTFAAAGVLSYSLTTYRNSVRQAILDQAKEIADGEMEFLYYQWKTALLAGNAVANVSCLNPTTQAANPASPLVSSGVCSTATTDMVTPFSSNISAGGWTVSRMVVFNPVAGTSDGSAQGLLPGSLETGKNYYFSAYTVASIVNPVLGPIQYHSGRHFVFSSTSLFQFAVFYQGNLEIAAGGNMTIQGPVSTNASAYMGSQPGYQLTIADTVYYFQDYNGASDPLSGETDRLEGTGALVDPIYNPNPQAAAPANQALQRADQVVKLLSQTSFIGGVDVANDIATYPAAYTNPQGVVDPNEVYRAVVAPPPTDSLGNLLPEDQVVAASRMYNRAGLLITINQPTSGPLTVDVGTAANPSAYTALFSSVINQIVPTTRALATDKRELANGTTNIELSTLDVGKLNDALATLMPANPTLQAGYNGLVYVYDNSNNTALGLPNNLNAVLIQNATTTPNYPDQNGNPLGFSIASNNGIFVQGDYNTTQITVSATQIYNPSAIMGDAVTAVSEAWSPTESSQPISGRVAIASPPTLGDISTGGVNPPSSGTANGMTINAAILTGNTPSTATTNSGGVQNLVRMEEDWWSPSLTLNLYGSLGQLFVSDYFRGDYVGNGYQASISDKVYVQPSTRNMSYDTDFKKWTPNSAPTTTDFSRGDFFFW